MTDAQGSNNERGAATMRVNEVGLIATERGQFRGRLGTLGIWRNW